MSDKTISPGTPIRYFRDDGPETRHEMAGPLGGLVIANQGPPDSMVVDCVIWSKRGEQIIVRGVGVGRGSRSQWCEPAISPATEPPTEAAIKV